MDIDIQRHDIYEALKDAVIDGLALMGDAERQGRYIRRYRDFPQMSGFLGWPSFSNVMPETAPLDYSTVLEGRSVFEKSLLPDSHSAEDLPSWHHFVSLARGDSYLSQYWTTDEFHSSIAQRFGMEDFLEKYYPLQSIKLDKKRVITLKEKETIPTVALGIDLLGFAIQVLSRNPQYLDPGLIDQYLLDSEPSSFETA